MQLPAALPKAMPDRRRRDDTRHPLLLRHISHRPDRLGAPPHPLRAGAA